MANTTIQLKKSVIPGNIPASLADGELAINTADGILFYKDPSNVIKTIQTGSGTGTTNSFSTLNVNSSLLIATSNDSILTIDSEGAITLTADSLYDKVTVGVKSASTSQQGVVQLYDGKNSNSTVMAATANSIQAVYAYIDTIQSGTVSNFTTNYKSEEFIATTGQDTFTVTGGYTPEYISVYVNGVLLSSSDYTAVDGSDVIISVPASSGDLVSIGKWFFVDYIYPNAQQELEEFVSGDNQTEFYIFGTYTAGHIKVYRNGVLLENSAYDASGGSLVVLFDGANLGDIISIEYWGASSIDATPVYILANAASSTANTALDIAENKLDKLDQGDFYSGIANTVVNTANQILDVFSTSVYRSAKYYIQVSSGVDYQSSEVMIIHDGTNSYITEYGVVATSNTLISLDCDINSGNVRLLVSPINNTNQIKFVKTLITV